MQGSRFVKAKAVQLALLSILALNCGPQQEEGPEVGTLNKAIFPPTVTGVAPPYCRHGSACRFRILGSEFEPSSVSVSVNGDVVPLTPGLGQSSTVLQIDMQPVTALSLVGRKLPMTVENVPGMAAYSATVPDAISIYADEIEFGLPNTWPGLKNAEDLLVNQFTGGDTTYDVALIAGNPGRVMVLPGLSDGRFGSPRLTPLPYHDVSAIASADLNGDRCQDIVAVYHTSPFVTTLLNDCNGYFRTVTSPTIPRWDPTRVVLVDFDCDGRLDLVATGPDGSWLQMRGSGGGVFTTLTNGPMPLACLPQDLKAADLNGDGRTDLAVACQMAPGMAGSGGALIFYHNGYPAPFGRQYDASYSIRRLGDRNLVSVAPGLFNGDLKQDLAVVEKGGHLSVLLQQSDGSFPVTPTLFPMGFAHRFIDSTDVNGDGKIDLVLTGVSGGGRTNQMTIAYGDGTGAWSILPASTGMPAAGGKVVNLNGGYPDLVLFDAAPTVTPASLPAGADGNISVLYGNGLSFAVANGFPVGTSGSRSSGITAFDCARRPCIAVTEAPASFADGTLYLYGWESQRPVLKRGYTVGRDPKQPVLGDFTRDGWLDLVVPNFGSGSVTILSGSASGELNPVPITLNLPAGNSPFTAAVGDVNNDMFPDIAVLTWEGTVFVFRNNKTGGFLPPVSFATGSRQRAAIAVAGGLIYVANSETSEVAWWLINPMNGMPTAVARTTTAGKRPLALLAQDFNGDGRVDLLVANEEPSVEGGANVSMLLGTMMGFQKDETRSFASTPKPDVLLLSDVNKDGDLDLIIGGASAIETRIGMGKGYFAPAARQVTRPTSANVASFDLTGDRRPELLVTHELGGTFYVVNNQSP